PAPDALHHPGRLPLSRPPAELAPAREKSAAVRAGKDTRHRGGVNAPSGASPVSRLQRVYDSRAAVTAPFTSPPWAPRGGEVDASVSELSGEEKCVRLHAIQSLRHRPSPVSRLRRARPLPCGERFFPLRNPGPILR